MKFHVSLFALLMTLVLISGCSGDGSITPSSSSGAFGTVLSTSVSGTAPNLTATTSQNLIGKMADPWNPGSGNYEIFNLLRKYTYPNDEGHLDMTNLYKALWELENKANTAEEMCGSSNELSSTGVQIASPFAAFDQEADNYTYDCAFNDGTLVDNYAMGVAMRHDSTNNIYYLNYGWQWAGNANGGSIGTALAKFDDTNKDLTFEMINCVDCGDPGAGSRFTVRTKVTGNPETHNFVINTVSGTPTNWKAIAGAGVSQGAGGFMLLKYLQRGGTATYYCIASDATEDDLQAATGILLAAVGGTSCAALEGTVEGVNMFSDGDIPEDFDAFVGSTILLSIP